MFPVGVNEKSWEWEEEHLEHRSEFEGAWCSADPRAVGVMLERMGWGQCWNIYWSTYKRWATVIGVKSAALASEQIVPPML